MYRCDSGELILAESDILQFDHESEDSVPSTLESKSENSSRIERSATGRFQIREAEIPEGLVRKYTPGRSTGEAASGMRWERMVHLGLKHVLSLPWS